MTTRRDAAQLSRTTELETEIAYLTRERDLVRAQRDQLLDDLTAIDTAYLSRAELFQDVQRLSERLAATAGVRAA